MNKHYSAGRLSLLGLIFLLLMVFSANLSFAQTGYSGPQGGSWNDPANWSNGLPAPGNDATIGGGASVNIDADELINYNVSSFGQITISATVTVDGNLQTFFSSTTITSAGSLIVNGTHDNRGTLNIDGAMTVSAGGNYLSDGSGNINLAANANLTNNGNFANQATMNIDGTFENTGFAAINGLMNINSGGLLKVSAGSVNTAFGSNQEVKAGGLLQVSGGAYNNEGTTTNNGIIENFATITSIANAILRNNNSYINRTGSQLTNAKEFINTGTFTNESGATVNNNFNYLSSGNTDNFGIWNNNGNINNQAGGTFTNRSGSTLKNDLGSTIANANIFINDGTLESEGSISNTGDFTNNGTIGTTVNGFIDNFNMFVNTSLIENMASINNKVNAMFLNTGTISNDSGGAVFNDGDFNNQMAGMLTNNFEFTNNNQLSNSGMITNGVRIFNNGTITNNGDLSNIGDLNNNAAGIIDNNNVLDNNGGGILTNDGTINNNSTLINNDCSIIINNNNFNNLGTFSNVGIIWQFGTYSGTPFEGTGIELNTTSSNLVCQDINALIGLDGEAVIFGSSVAADFLKTCEDLNLQVNGVDSIIYDCSNVGPNTVEFRLEDRLGNFITCTSTVTVVENTPPVFTNCPANFTVETDGGNTAVVNWTEPTVSDNNGPATFTSTSSPGDVFELGQTTVTYTSSADCNGNVGSCAFNVDVVLPPPPPPSASCGSRVTEGLVALYDFREGSGNIVEDVSGVGQPLNLTIQDPNNVAWLPDCGLDIEHATIIKSAGPATKIINAVKASNEITLEAWVTPDNLTQNGPARIMTLSKDTGNRNTTLGQADSRYIARFRTTSTNNNGMPNINTGNGSVKTELQHVVYTRSSDNTERLYVDGELLKTKTRGGNTSNWDNSYKFALANEFTNNRVWKGEIYLAAVYSKALSETEVQTNFAQGECCSDELSTNVWLEAECAEVGSNWQILYDQNASEGFFATITPGLNSTSTPPSSPDDYVRFNFEVSEAGDYKVFGRVVAPSGSDNSFWVRANGGTWVKWNGIQGSSSFVWDQVHDNNNSNTPVTFALNQGANTVDFAYREDGTKLDKVFVTLTGDTPTGEGEAASNCVTDVYAEAECAEVGSNFNLYEDPDASNGQYMKIAYGNNSYNSAPTGAANRIRFTIEVTAGGNYKIFGRVRANNGGNDSFWVRANNGSWVKWNGIEKSNNFIWDQVHNFDNNSTPVTFALEAGTNTVDFAYREDGTRLDKIFVTLSGDTPTGEGEPATNCDEVVPCNDEVLFIVGSTNLNHSDAAIKARLEGMGMTVEVVDDNQSETSDADGKGLIVISSTTFSGAVGTKYTDLAIPVVTWESWLYDDLKMTGPTAHTDYGEFNSTSIIVFEDSSHPLAAGLNGSKEVTEQNINARWGKPANSAIKVGRINVDASKFMLFGYETGTQMVGMTAPARRVGFFANNNSAEIFTNNGWALFEASIYWAKGCAGSGAGLVRSESEETVEADRAETVEEEEETGLQLNNGVELGAFKMYPNPATTLVTLDLEAYVGQSVNITVFDQLSRSIYQNNNVNWSEGQLEINTSQWESGIYLVRIDVNGEQSEPRKLVIIDRN